MKIFVPFHLLAPIKLANTFTSVEQRMEKGQANMGAKNHASVLPDADKEGCINAIVGAAFGAAGQRCMALSTCILLVMQTYG